MPHLRRQIPFQGALALFVTLRLKESVNVSLSAARLGMLTQREILMEELESQAVPSVSGQVAGECINVCARLGAPALDPIGSLQRPACAG